MLLLFVTGVMNPGGRVHYRICAGGENRPGGKRVSR
jgi:hypothetical protein